LGTNKKVFYPGKNNTYSLGNVEHAAYWLSYRESNYVIFEGETVEIKELWKRLRDALFDVFPHAIETSIRISKEQKYSRSGGGRSVGPKNLERFTGDKQYDP